MFARGLARVAPLLVVLACARAPLKTARPATGPSLKVMTYNVNFGMAGDASILGVIEECGADVVFLQETNPAWQREIEGTLAASYPHRSFRHHGGAGGLGVLSRLPYQDGGLLRPAGGGFFPAWRVVVTSPLGPIQVLNVHLRPPVSDSGSFVAGYFSTPRVREAELAAFVDRLDPALPTLIVGDFNEADGRAMRFLASRGLTSALPMFRPDAHTWHWPTWAMTLRDRLDHIVHDARLDVVSADVLYQGRSDHFPVTAVVVPRGMP